MSQANNSANNVPMDPLSKAFGLEPMNHMLKPNGKIILPDMDDDYEFNKQEIIDVLEKAKSYMQQFGEVAVAAQEPRHFEVLNNMISTIIDGHTKLIDMKATDRAIKEKEAKSNPTETTVNNNLMVGSTEEMIAMIESLEEKQKQKKKSK
jgi:hypothetical protein